MSSLSQLHQPKRESAKRIKVTHCQGADLGDWLQQAQYYSLTRCFVIFLGLYKTLTLCARVNTTNTNKDNEINANMDSDNVHIS